MAKHILERIYYHLMRQSDLGIAYDESLENNFNVETEVDMDVGEGEDDEDDDEMPIMVNKIEKITDFHEIFI